MDSTVETQKTFSSATLSDEQLNRKVAKLCGWKDSVNGFWWHNDYGDGPPPDYCNDLNAMHEAEKRVLESSRPWSSGSDHEPVQYPGHLSKIVGMGFRRIQVLSGKKYGGGDLILETSVISSPFEQIKIVHATARQKAEAFVQTLSGKESEADSVPDGNAAHTLTGGKKRKEGDAKCDAPAEDTMAESAALSTEHASNAAPTFDPKSAAPSQPEEEKRWEEISERNAHLWLISDPETLSKYTLADLFLSAIRESHEQKKEGKDSGLPGGAYA